MPSSSVGSVKRALLPPPPPARPRPRRQGARPSIMAFGGPPQQRPNKHSFPSEEPRSRRASDRRQPPPAGAKRKKGRAAAKAKAGTFDAMGLLPDVLRGIRRKVRRSSRRGERNVRTPNQAAHDAASRSASFPAPPPPHYLWGAARARRYVTLKARSGARRSPARHPPAKATRPRPSTCLTTTFPRRPPRPPPPFPFSNLFLLPSLRATACRRPSSARPSRPSCWAATWWAWRARAAARRRRSWCPC